MTRYGCNTTASGPRGQNRILMVQDGWTLDGRRIMRPHTTDWLQIKCGNIEQQGLGPDPLCKGCENFDG